MRLEKRNNGGWVLVTKHAATGLDCEAPFDVIERERNTFELWGEVDGEPSLLEAGLSKKGVLDLAEVMMAQQ